MARIAYVLGIFPLMSETFIGQEIRAMEAAGHEVTILALHPAEGECQPEDAALASRTHYFANVGNSDKAELMRRYRFTFLRLRAYARAQTTEPAALFPVRAARAADIIKAQRCTRVHAHFAWGAAAYAIAAARLLKLPVSFTCHGSDVYARPWDLALKCKNADAVFAVAPTITADLRKIAGNTPCHTVYCGVDTERFKPLADVTRKHGRWLFVGRLVDCKGVDDILQSWALLPTDKRPQLDIVGDGAMRQALQAMVLALGLDSSIAFLGEQSSSWIAENTPAYRAFIAAFKQGSDGSRDTSPLVLKEAMAMALPIVTTRFIDIPALVGEECALLCPPSSPESLANAVSEMQNLPLEKLQQMGYAGRHRVEQHYTLQQQVVRITQLLRLSGE